MNMSEMEADLARETELRRTAERHVRSLQAYIATMPYPSDYEEAREEVGILRAKLKTLTDLAGLAR